MVQYFIANPDAKELIAFPDGKAFLNNTTNSYDALSYGKATNQVSKIVFRDEFKKEIEAELKRIEGAKNGIVSSETETKETKTNKKK